MSLSSPRVQVHAPRKARSPTALSQLAMKRFLLDGMLKLSASTSYIFIQCFVAHDAVVVCYLLFTFQDRRTPFQKQQRKYKYCSSPCGVANLDLRNLSK